MSVLSKKGIPIIATHVNTGYTYYFDSFRSAEKYGFYNSKISECISGKYYTHKKHTFRKATNLEVVCLTKNVEVKNHHLNLLTDEEIEIFATVTNNTKAKIILDFNKEVLNNVIL